MTLHEIRKKYNGKHNLAFGLGCIPTRILLGVAIWYISEINNDSNKILASILFVVGLIGILFNVKSFGDNVWWSRPFEILVCLSIVVLSILSLLEIIETKWIAVAIWIDAVVGVILKLIFRKE